MEIDNQELSDKPGVGQANVQLLAPKVSWNIYEHHSTPSRERQDVR